MELLSESAIKVSSYKRKYWQYQYKLAWEYLIPQMLAWGFDPKGKEVLDIGCAEGGAMAALEDHGAFCTGIEISPSRVELGKILCNENHRRESQFIVGDFLADSLREILPGYYDLLLLRDVFEHLPEKTRALERLRSLLKDKGKILITFPPFYSPFGGHQQMLSSKFKYVPYVHLLPEPFFGLWSNWLGQKEANRFILSEMRFFRQERLSLAAFEKLVAKKSLKIVRKKFYLSSPSHKYRYGFKVIEGGPLGGVPILREFFMTGAAYFLAAA